MNKAAILNLGRPEAKAAAEPPGASPSGAPLSDYPIATLATAADVETAARIVRELTEKRGQVAARVDEISEERKSLAFAAHADGDPIAGQRLHALNAEGATIAGELEAIDAAIAEGQARLDGARQTEAKGADRANALELRKVLAEFAEHGRKMDEALAVLVAASAAFTETLNKIHALGSDFPTHAQAHVNASMALSTALMLTPWRREFRHLAPREKRTFGEVTAAWAQPIENGIRLRLGESEEEAA